jgi:thiol-disulfide isomerase/thioredoxin
MSRASSTLITVAVIAGAAAAGFAGYRLTREAPAPVAAAPAPEASSGKAELPGPSAQVVPQTLPDVEIPDRTGKVRKLSEWQGRPLVVNFWATWCAPCRKEIPLLEQIRAQRAADGLEVIGIAVDTTEDVLRFADEIGIDYPVLIADENGFEVTQAFGVVMAFPVSVFADKQSRIVAVKVGELHADEAALILDRVRDVDAKKLDLAAAREQIELGLQTLATERAREAAEQRAREIPTEPLKPS